MTRRPPMRPTQDFSFSLEVGIADTLFLSAGELAELIGDGLTLLDRQGALFPGVEHPDGLHMLSWVNLQATGFARQSEPGAKHRYNRLLRGGGGTPRPALKLLDQLDRAAAALGEGIVRQRLLRAQLIAAGNAIVDPKNPARHDLAASQALLEAAQKVVAAVAPAGKQEP